uniref:deoxyuridine 5'-triphosphate nucleotidohydrolase, mitochondrial isoform X2 n=1 Tax=Callithrix jacchus TaxID=9483 RepID=UPI0023DD48DC|nr:deoxyuridine 5'-triphosphate nucleotidohydrolase, mitochondrial isoform X2 [Callithrix jacchus]
MTPICPRPALCYHFLPSLLRSAIQNATGARLRAEAAGLSEPGQPLGRAAQHGRPRPLSSAGRLSRGCRGAKTPAVSPSKRARPAEEGVMQLRFARLSEHATAPTRGSARAAGYDLYSAYDYTIPPMEKALVKTDIQIALPSGCYGRVAPRSGLAAKHFIDVGGLLEVHSRPCLPVNHLWAAEQQRLLPVSSSAGVIDEDYRGNVGVVLFNFGKEKFEVKKGDRIAQLICERIFYPEIEEVQALDDTKRGSGGFGSTGKN